MTVVAQQHVQALTKANALGGRPKKAISAKVRPARHASVMSVKAAAVSPSSTVESNSSLGATRGAAGAAAIKERQDKNPNMVETMVPHPPDTLIRPDTPSDSMMRRYEKMVRETQDKVCAAIEEIDGSKFRTDAFVRPNGGGGITRVMQGGRVWEKAGVAVSVVYGTMPAESYRVAAGNKDIVIKKGDRVPFATVGVSSVMHPWNPHCPTMHFNYRYFTSEEYQGIPPQWWFGGGTDITPSYVDEEDMKHFHGTYKAVCDKHDPEYFPKFKKWCDEYFYIKHRGETRGLGGIFYDDQNDREPEKIFNFASDCANAIPESYCRIIRKHMSDPYTPQQKEWQQLRRGRYAEFNLVYDRGTIFGLKTGAGRTESMLMSLPLTASWRYDHHPEANSPEAEFLDAARHPRDWV